MYFNCYFNLNEYNDECEYAVFDDIAGGFEYFHNYKGWLGSQKEFTVTDKYRPKRLVKWGRPTIMLTNDDPTMDPKVDSAWLHGNCDIIFVGTPFIHNVTEAS